MILINDMNSFAPFHFWEQQQLIGVSMHLTTLRSTSLLLGVVIRHIQNATELVKAQTEI